MTTALQPSAGAALAEGRWSHDRYLLRKKVFTLFGGAFHIYDPLGNVAFYSKMKAFKLKEDLRLYGDEGMASELLTIKARHIIDFSAAYDVADPQTGEKIGALKRKGLKSMIRDEWIILDALDNEVGLIQEDSQLRALLRRLLLGALLPQSFTGTLQGAPVFHFEQHFNPFVRKISLDFCADREKRLDRRVGIAAALLLCALEGRQGGVSIDMGG